MNFEDGEHKRLLKSELPALLFPPTRTRLMNDMVACGEGVLAANSTRKFSEVFTTLWRASTPDIGTTLLVTGDGAPSSDAAAGMEPCTHVVVNVGTGLGNIALFHLPDLPSTPAGTGVREWLVTPLEAGHQTVTSLPKHAAFLDAAAVALRDGGKYPVEWDDLCSGRGLEFAYVWCKSQAESRPVASTVGLSAKEIGSSWSTDAIAEAALLLHYEMVLRFTANLVITAQVGGVACTHSGGGDGLTVSMILLSSPFWTTESFRLFW